MHLISSLLILGFAAILTSSVPVKKKHNLRSKEMRDKSMVSAVQQNSPIIPAFISRNRRFCFRLLSDSLAPGTPSGFKGWIRKYHSGYVAADEKLYHFFRCGASNAEGKRKRVRRDENTPTPPLPRPE